MTATPIRLAQWRIPRVRIALEHPGLTALRPYLLATLSWAIVAVFVGLQQYVGRSIGGETARVVRVFGQGLPLIVIWALATPAILWSVRRWPLRRPLVLQHGLIHFAFGSVFVVLLNAFAAWFLNPESVTLARWAQYTVSALVTWYHLALMVYLAVVAAGHVVIRHSASLTDSNRSTTGTELSEPLADNHAPSQRATVSLDVPVAPAAAETPPGEYLTRLAVKIHYRIHLVDVTTIDWIEASDDTVRLHLGDHVYPYRQTLKSLEQRLDPAVFVRVHRSAMVNLARVREAQPYFHGDYILILKNGKQLRLSRTRREQFEARLGQGL